MRVGSLCLVCGSAYVHLVDQIPEKTDRPETWVAGVIVRFNVWHHALVVLRKWRENDIKNTLDWISLRSM